ncbi:MAG: M24 family metallopeptidase, partial [Anaerolineaceae bacterium]|nr:M24 family metallopeptidase [Anaerolineaceae bacterium]
MLEQNRGMDKLVSEKVQQAIGLLNRQNIDLWLICTQETGYECDPVYPLIMGERDIARGYLLLTRQGEKIAIVGGLDEAIPASTGVWNDVRVYSGNAAAALRGVLSELNPQSIAINYSMDIPSADGLSYGGYLRLMETLKDTLYARSVVSAEKLALGLRSVKSAEEISRIRTSIAKTDTVFNHLREYLMPGLSGMQIFGFIQEQITAAGAVCAWSRYNCPVLTMGPVPFMGHTPPPAGMNLEKGWLLQVDLGLKFDGYCSDFQRMFYVLADGEDGPPVEIRELFDHVHNGITTMINTIKPGVRNDYPSSLGFSQITAHGFPEPKYSAGHQLGRAVHDGGVGLVNFRSPRPE